jgi:thiazole synthase
MLNIANIEFSSRLFLGTGKFASHTTMAKAIKASASQLVTVALKRLDFNEINENILDYLPMNQIRLLPNTSGAKTADEAICAAQLARETLKTNLLKLEIHPDNKYLLPDPIETLKACEKLVKLGFIVLPYIHADPVLCKRLEDAGAAAVMPLGSPIGSNLGLLTEDFLKIIIDQSNVPVIVDAGIGKPSDAAKAMELGADAVLVNTAIAIAKDPIAMAAAFRDAVIAGRIAYFNSSNINNAELTAQASSPITSFLDILDDIPQ